MVYTGEETAIELVRQCFVNRPLSQAEHAKLTNLVQFSTLPALPLLCHDLQHSASQLHHLPFGHSRSDQHNANYDQETEACSKVVFQNAATAYLCARQKGPCNPRTLLTPLEEERMLGICLPTRYNPVRQAVVVPSPENVDALKDDDKEAHKVGQETLSDVIARIALMTHVVGEKTDLLSGPPPFPLVAQSGTHLEASMLQEQQASWVAHHSLEVRILSDDPEDIYSPTFLAYTHQRVIGARERLERYLLKVMFLLLPRIYCSILASLLLRSIIHYHYYYLNMPICLLVS
jgi:hypothetical protein